MIQLLINFIVQRCHLAIHILFIVGFHPCFKFKFYFFTGRKNLGLAKLSGLSVKLIPVVAQTCQPIAVHQSDVGILLHVFFIHVHDVAANLHTHGTFFATQVAHTFTVGVTGGAAGIAHNHGKIACCCTLQTHREKLFGLIGLVVFVHIGRFVVCARINAEHAEIACMTGPAPVIGFPTKFAHVFRGSTHQTNIAIHLVIHGKKAISSPKRYQFHDVVYLIIAQGCFQLFFSPAHRFHYGFIAVGFRHVNGNDGKHLLCNILHLAQQSYIEIGGALLFFGFGPETIAQNIVLGGAKLLYSAITAMVVGKKQTFTAYDFAGAKHAALFAHEAHHGVFERSVVDTVNVCRSQLQAFCLHGILQFCHHGQGPHAFIGTQSHSAEHSKQ